MTGLACWRMKTTRSKSWQDLVNIPSDEDSSAVEPGKNYEE